MNVKELKKLLEGASDESEILIRGLYGPEGDVEEAYILKKAKKHCEDSVGCDDCKLEDIDGECMIIKSLRNNWDTKQIEKALKDVK